ncbi:DUF433 domain-containing protein [Dyadobacter aurulentus]|uniref:DUF433 domain-containing protein n=1 Tax=Dyadobacter sp. UC 10 TaxID=2605428 RepID=UPI001CECAE25|nr:DUF433 domain-containing protein [Dyadobacter sp. UC 10]
MNLERITFDSRMMGGKPCIRGMRITVGTIVGLVASGQTFDEILRFIPISNLRILIRHYPVQPGAPKSWNYLFR